jgi:hypothetical protein
MYCSLAVVIYQASHRTIAFIQNVIQCLLPLTIATVCRCPLLTEVPITLDYRNVVNDVFHAAKWRYELNDRYQSSLRSMQGRSHNFKQSFETP